MTSRHQIALFTADLWWHLGRCNVTTHLSAFKAKLSQSTCFSDQTTPRSAHILIPPRFSNNFPRRQVIQLSNAHRHLRRCPSPCRPRSHSVLRTLHRLHLVQLTQNQPCYLQRLRPPLLRARYRFRNSFRMVRLVRLGFCRLGRNLAARLLTMFLRRYVPNRLPLKLLRGLEDGLMVETTGAE